MQGAEVGLRQRVLLAFQVALLGMVGPTLRGVTVGWDERRIRARFFFDGPAGEEERDVCSDVEAEVLASFPDYEVEVTAERSDSPRDLAPGILDAWVYRRKE